jgi:porphobilinogen synthase
MKIYGKYPTTRLRRIRNTSWLRELVSDNELHTNDLILPIFIREGKNKIEKIKSMPGVYRYTIDKLNVILNEVKKNKILLIALFPYTPEKKKDEFGSEALNENNLICKALRFIKKRYPSIGVMCDIALDPYTVHGHDGVIIKNKIANDETIEVLVKQAILNAHMGCDLIAPSDMMDGRIGAIRKALDKNNFTHLPILSYATKFASSYYGPFRDAVGSKSNLKSNKKTYQMDFRNSNESLREIALDIKEGADIIMVKPGMPYLDVIKNAKDNFKVPIFAYQVSGEYSLIKNGIKKKLINENVILESLMAFKRAGASAIVTYFALEVAKKLKHQLK